MKKFFLSLFVMSIGLTASSQMYDEMRHNTNYNNAWISCYSLPSPNGDRGEGHWIMYDLRHEYDLFQFTFWNLNDPERLNDGIQEVSIDVSNNGNDWSQVGNYNIPISDGSAFYRGVNAIDLNGISARYVLLTANSNYGGSCYGLSEVKIGVSESSLPVTLVDFGAECDEDVVKLNWIVKSEYNNEAYTAQVSLDGIEWTDFATIPGENKQEENEYELIYSTPSAAVEYFRIIQKDYDGSLTYFPVAKAVCNDLDASLTITPNPVASNAVISFSDWNSEGKSYRITNSVGKNVKSGILQQSDEELDLTFLTPGTYFIIIGDGNVQYREKFIKL